MNLYVWKNFHPPEKTLLDTKKIQFCFLKMSTTKSFQNVPTFPLKNKFSGHIFCLDIHFSCLPHNNVYFVTRLPESNRQMFHVQKTIPNRRNSSHPQQGFSSSQGNLIQLRKKRFRLNKLPPVPHSTIQTPFCSVNGPN